MHNFLEAKEHLKKKKKKTLRSPKNEFYFPEPYKELGLGEPIFRCVHCSYNQCKTQTILSKFTLQLRDSALCFSHSDNNFNLFSQ